jgi:hypothetical protein
MQCCSDKEEDILVEGILTIEAHKITSCRQFLKFAKQVQDGKI